MTILHNLDMLIQYERIDAPKDANSRYGWKMYTSKKIAEFLGVRSLSVAIAAQEAKPIALIEEQLTQILAERLTVNLD